MPFFLLLALPWNWIGSNSDLHFWGQWMPSFAETHPFNGIHSALLKDHVDLQTIVRKEQGTEDVEIFFG